MNGYYFKYNEIKNRYELSIGNLSLLDSLLLFDKSDKLLIHSFGATCYKKYGWATENHLPSIETVGSFIDFLNKEGDIGIIECHLTLIDIVNITYKDDNHCHFVFDSKKRAMSLIKALMPLKNTGKLISTLQKNHGQYFR